MADKSHLKSRAPVANSIRSFWNSQTHNIDDHCSTADLPKSSDVVIIGAGFAGIATAYHLLRDNLAPPNIVLLEARTVCSGATGRNGGHVKPDSYYAVQRNAKLYGDAAAAEVAAFERSNLHAVKDLVEREDLNCDFHLTRGIDVYLDPAHSKATEEAYKRLAASGLIDLRDVAFTPKRDAERISGVKGAQCCISSTAAHIWPSQMLKQLLQRLLSEGLNLQTNTPVLSVSSSHNDQNLWTVSTPRGSIATRKVIYATNAYTAQILPEYLNRIVPVRGICSHIVSPPGESSPRLVNTYKIQFDQNNHDYLIPRADGSFIVGGARERFLHQKEQWFDNVDDSKLMTQTASYFEGYMQRVFQGWESSNTHVEKIWTGIMGYSSDFMPHVGPVPGKNGQFIIAGFTGHGMPHIFLSSKGLASMVHKSTLFDDSGIPQCFQTTEKRLISEQNPLEDSFQPLWDQFMRPNL